MTITSKKHTRKILKSVLYLLKILQCTQVNINDDSNIKFEDRAPN